MVFKRRIWNWKIIKSQLGSKQQFKDNYNLFNKQTTDTTKQKKEMAVTWYFKQLNQFNEEERQQVYDIRDETFCDGGEKDLGCKPLDEIDEYCYHSFAWGDEGLMAYCRVIQEKEDLYRIARVLVHKRARGKGMGQQLINYTCDQIKEYFDGREVTLDALEYIHSMYLKVGFFLTGGTTDFNGIPALTMNRLLK